MQELRCPHCDRLLGKADLMPGSRVEIQCRTKKCKEMNKSVIQFGSKATE